MSLFHCAAPPWCSPLVSQEEWAYRGWSTEDEWLHKCSWQKREYRSHRSCMASRRQRCLWKHENSVCQGNGVRQGTLGWPWMLDFGVLYRGDQGVFWMPRPRSEGHSIVLATGDSQLRIPPSPCLCPTFLPTEEWEAWFSWLYFKILCGLHFPGVRLPLRDVAIWCLARTLSPRGSQNNSVLGTRATSPSTVCLSSASELTDVLH